MVKRSVVAGRYSEHLCNTLASIIVTALAQARQQRSSGKQLVCVRSRALRRASDAFCGAWWHLEDRLSASLLGDQPIWSVAWTYMASPPIWPDSTSPVRGSRSFSSGTKRAEARRMDPGRRWCQRSIIRYRKGRDPKPYAYAIKLRTPTVTLVSVPLSEAEIYCCDGK